MVIFITVLLLVATCCGAAFAAVPPIITKQPANATYSKSATARFYVNAHTTDNGYLTYQWYRSDTFSAPQADTALIKQGATPLPEGAAATLTTTTISDFAGTKYCYYWVVIKNTRANETSSTVSDFALTKIVDRTLYTSLQNGGFDNTSYWSTTHTNGNI